MQKIHSSKSNKYYYDNGMLYCVSNEKIYALIQGKGWMLGWDAGGSIKESNLISESDARKKTESQGEIFGNIS